MVHDPDPGGEYTFRVVEDLGAGAAYGQDGAVDGAEVSLTVPEDGMVATIEYDAASHEIRTRTGAAEQPAAGPDLGAARAAWVGADLLAVSAGTGPAGADPARLDWSLTWGPDGALALDAETVTGGRSVPVTVAELPAGVVAEHPELAGGTALRVDRRTARQAGEILAGQAVVSATDGTGRIVAATGVTDAR